MKKVVLDLEAIKVVPEIRQLLQDYHIIEISGEGSREHTRAGLYKDKVLLKAYSKRQGESKSE